MNLSEFDFPFDPTLIASEPVLPRHAARLLCLDSQTGNLSNRRVADLPELLAPGDLLVVNDTKVMAARLSGRKQPTGTVVDVLFVKDCGDAVWEVMLKGHFRVGQAILFEGDASATVVQRDEHGTKIKVASSVPVVEFLRTHGCMPLPPYIKRSAQPEDHVWYQTCFADREGAIAAPTAGLHFTPELMARLRDRGVETAAVTLHVGPGTFKPVVVERIEEHQMGTEWFDVSERTVEAILKTKRAGGRVIAIGTTAVRALESAAQQAGGLQPTVGESRLFISPGFRFNVVDALMTNFHLPRTTLLMLVSALAGVDMMRKAYAEAVEQRYRFYSYGDAMLIL
ncbi:tRNA preQ1(34) S-adenosylmethionine ribosyltransferase-isomerase QueA [Nitrospira lenta]|uniref:S-adenosylmethionine:tRNA ribosyltransferase-isomerase n=1 Tax=Nitrospira lenta TaxID=1436998 RepID=A0A330L2H0_9BACT|nr:tRNA preQ1(34) S-adenosylmethionine ribosyltransferase-isomerase QueA [Nitrospira lenta]SPP63403.1 S-adenosylmethionine:tRNA ribosyltransferase-isomerase [Nitrospira lenta]